MAGTSHAALMDRTYRHQRRIYDLTRAWFLLGRDHLIADLDPPAGARVLEIACGTGRNLEHVSRRYPDTVLYGLDISAQMLASARARPRLRAALALGDASGFDPQALFGVARFDRIILSYSLSMIPDWRGALVQACRLLAPGGSLHVVDFGTQTRLAHPARAALNAWLARFHVTPRVELVEELRILAQGEGAALVHRELWRSYAQYAVLRHRGCQRG